MYPKKTNSKQPFQSVGQHGRIY